MNPTEMHGHHGFDGGFSVLPLFGSLLLLLIVLAGLAAFYLWRHGRLALPGSATHRSPEDQAKQILADRFAHGDISTDDFMERSAILNWTPGSEAIPHRRRRGKRH